ILLRFATIGIFVERSLATYFFENYEHKSDFKFVGFWISLLALLFSALMGAAYQTGLYPFNIHVGAVVFVDCGCFVVSYSAKIYSNKMMTNKKSLFSKSKLFQIF